MNHAWCIFQPSTDRSCLVSWPLRIWNISHCDNLLYFIYFHNLLSSQFDYQRHMKWQIILRWKLIPIQLILVLHERSIWIISRRWRIGRFIVQGNRLPIRIKRSSLCNRKNWRKEWSKFDILSVMLTTRPSVMYTLTPDTRIRTCVMMRKLIVGSIIRRLDCSGMQPRCNLWIASIVGCQSNHILTSQSSEQSEKGVQM